VLPITRVTRIDPATDGVVGNLTWFSDGLRARSLVQVRSGHLAEHCRTTAV